MNRNVVGVSDDMVADQGGLRVTLHTMEGPLSLAIPLHTAEVLLVALREGADDVHRMRIEQGEPLDKTIVSTDRPPLDTTGCFANTAQDGRILLQFRHAAAATTSLFVPRVGAAMLAKVLAELGGASNQGRSASPGAKVPVASGETANEGA